MKSQNLFLFAICSLIWGTTWLVIKFQINSTAPTVGVFYRFLIAALLMFAFNYFVTKKSLQYPLKNHVFFFLQGLFNFCLNYILTYLTEEKMSSGLVALTFTTLVYFNMIGMRLWFKKRISQNVIIGGLFGVVGIILLFWSELKGMQAGSVTTQGLLLGILATFFASTGNMFAFKNHLEKIPVVVFNSFGMLYGSLSCLIIGLIRNDSFALPTSVSFLLSLSYLAIFGSVIAFWAYQTLVGTIGAEKAAYSSIISPMIAVIVSSIFENVQLTSTIILGIFFCLLGNIISLKSSK
ncbi:MAG: EamA family transporter [Bacteriovorax sp.]|nr:EamA family transporter [Bacteriovorax sp.]